MARTVRKLRKTSKTVRDGHQQYRAWSCGNNKGCPYCENNRLHRHSRRAPLQET